MFRVLTVTACATVALMAAPASAGSVVNGSFDSCTTTGYSATGSTGSSASYGGINNGTNCFGYATGGAAGVYSTLSQTIMLAAGETLSGIVGYYNAEATYDSYYNDNGYLSVGGNVLKAFDTYNAGSGFTGWQSFAFVAPTAGSYVLQIGARNVGDSIINSTIAIDNVSTSFANSAVPEPATWALFTLGFGLLGGVMRRQRKQRPTLSFA